MYKVLVVDDNTLIRKSIIKRIQWDTLNMVCVGEAANGAQAREMIDELLPDIVITDIKMPKEDGLFVIRHMRDRYPGIQFIVISGYDDFTYLKQSVQLQVINYILKPIDTAELTQTLQQAVTRIQKFQETCALQDKASNYKTLYDQEKLNSIFQSFLTSATDFNTFSEQLNQISCPFLKSHCCCIILNIPTGQAIETTLSHEIQTQLESLLEELFYPSGCIILNPYHGTYVSILSRTDGHALSQRHIEQCYTAVQKLLPSQYNVYLSCSTSVSIKKMRDAYQEALMLMLQRFLPSEANKTIFMPIHPISCAENYTFQSEWMIAFDLQLFDECKRILHEVLEKANRSLDVFASSALQLLDTINHCCTNKIGQPVFVLHSRELYLLMFASQQQLEDALCAVLDKLSMSTEQVDLGESVVKYLNENFTKPLTLQGLSELFHVNQIYLGQLIKKKTGQPFNSLLNSLRVNYAAESIRKNPDISFKNLAFSLGFTDAHYFTKVFKQYYSQTPSEYRTQILENEKKPES